MAVEAKFEHGFLEALFEAAQIGLGLVDRELRYVRVNDALAAINGLPAEDHEGRKVVDVIPGLAELAERLLSGVLETGEPVIDLKLSGPTPADPSADRDFLVSYYPVLEGSEVIGVGALVVEVTERVKARNELQDQARHIFENVVQDLTVAQLALDAGDVDMASAKTESALTEAKHITSKVLLEAWPL